MSRARILADYVSSGDELADKAPLASPAFTGTPTGIVTGSIADNAVTDAKIAGMSSSKLSGALPAISAASLTGLTSAQMPAGVSLQTVGLGLRVAWPANSVTVTFTPVIIDGLVKSIIPKKTDSNFVVSTGGYYITGMGARNMVILYARKSTTDTGNNFDTTPDVGEQQSSQNVTVTTQTVSGWTHIGTIGYSGATSIHNQTNFVRNATLPSYSAGETIQFGIALGSDTTGYWAKIVFGGNTSTASPYLFISEIGV
jgi:hypothetical protein